MVVSVKLLEIDTEAITCIPIRSQQSVEEQQQRRASPFRQIQLPASENANLPNANIIDLFGPASSGDMNVDSGGGTTSQLNIPAAVNSIDSDVEEEEETTYSALERIGLILKKVHFKMKFSISK